MNDTSSFVHSSDDLVNNSSAVSITANSHYENTAEIYFSLSTENGSSQPEGSANAINMQDLTNDRAYETLQRPDIGQPYDAFNINQTYDSLEEICAGQRINLYEN